jgi:VCBS repeat-containing protein
VHGANDGATISGTNQGDVYEDGTLKATAKLGISDVDTGENQLQPQSNVSAAYGTWTVAADGTWTYQLDNGKAQSLGSNESALETLTVKSQDGTATTQLKVTVHGVNDAPTITDPDHGNATTISVAENSAAVTTVKATDVDIHDTLTYSISGGADKDLFQIDSASGALSFKAAPDYENPLSSNCDNSYSVTVKVSDGHGGTDTQTLTVNVTNVPDGPVAANDYIFTAESGLFSVKDEWLTANDTGNALTVEDADAGANQGYFDPVWFIFPTPVESNGSTLIDLDTTAQGGDKTYLQNGDKTSFTYDAVDASHQTAIGTVEVTYITSHTIDRSADTHNDIIVGSLSDSTTMTGGSGNDVIVGGSKGDLIFGGGGTDTLYGGDGDDTLRYSEGDKIHGEGDNIDGSLLTDTAHRGDVLAFSASIDLTDVKYSGMFDGIETISLKNADSGTSGNQTLVVNATDVMGMSDNLIDPSGSQYSAKEAVRIDMDALDQLYLSVSKDGGKWTNIGTAGNGQYDVFVHDTNAAGSTGGSENAYVMVSHAAVNAGGVHLNTDPTPPAH